MDQYSKMCREAKEIQALWRKAIGDRAYYEDYDVDGYVTNGRLYKDDKDELIISGWWDWVHQDEYIWLPRIEDLIEMLNIRELINGGAPYWIDMFAKFNFSEKVNAKDVINVRVLKYVMYTLYVKLWTDETWESEEDKN